MQQQPNVTTTTISTTEAQVQDAVTGTKPRHNFTTNVLDHCETPRVAYQHILPVLSRLVDSSSGDMTLNNLKIWDPYYCNGAVQRHLNALGLKNVLHENKDFYKLIETNQIPNHNVLLTNPPYSDDHIERLLTFLNNNNKSDNDDSSDPHPKPFCLLLPNWVARKKEYKTLLTNHRTVFYLSPVEPYTYIMPSWVGVAGKQDNSTSSSCCDDGVAEGRRPDHVGDDGRTTPYLSSWYISAGSNVQTEALLQQLITATTSSTRSNEWVVAKTIKGLKWKIQKHQQRR